MISWVSCPLCGLPVDAARGVHTECSEGRQSRVAGEIAQGILRVESQNDRSNWEVVPKPPLGAIRQLDSGEPDPLAPLASLDADALIARLADMHVRAHASKGSYPEAWEITPDDVLELLDYVGWLREWIREYQQEGAPDER